VGIIINTNCGHCSFWKEENGNENKREYRGLK